MKTKKANGLRADDLLRTRLSKAKAVIEGDYVPLYEYEFGRQTIEVRQRVRNVWNWRLLDEEIICGLEIIAKHIENVNK